MAKNSIFSSNDHSNDKMQVLPQELSKTLQFPCKTCDTPFFCKTCNRCHTSCDSAIPTAILATDLQRSPANHALNLRIQFLRFFLATPAHGHPCYHKTRGKTCDSLKPSQCECNSCCSNCSSCSIVTANPVPHLIRAIFLNDSHTDCNSCGSNRNSRTSSL